MKFDFIIGNPPYQKNDGGGGKGASAIPLYNLFIDNCKSMDVGNMAFVIPSKWMTGGKGLDDFREKMINDKRMKTLVDFTNSKDVFPNAEIKGGVCYFLWSNEYEGQCSCSLKDGDKVYKTKRFLCEEGDNIFIRDGRLISIKNRVGSNDEPSVSNIVSARKPYGLDADVMKYPEKYGLPSFSDIPIKDGYAVLGLGDKQQRIWKYVPNDYPLPKTKGIDKYKVFIPKAYGVGNIGEAPSMPCIGIPSQLCTETFLQVGPFDTKQEAECFLKYLKGKFFRCLVSLKKQTHNTSQATYTYVPLQDFTPQSDIDWSQSIHGIDLQLYKKYGLTKEEIDFIETNVKEME